VSAPLSQKQINSIVRATSLIDSVPDVKISLWVGAVSAGKTIASLFAFLIAIKQTQGTGLIVIVGKTLQTIERNLLDPLMDERIYGKAARAIKHTKGSTVAVVHGKTVHLVGANDSKSEEKIRGSTIELAYVDEATLLPRGKDNTTGFWEMLVSRLRTPNPPRLLATTNPGSTRHWLRTEWILQARAKNMQVFHFTMDDNPSLTADYMRDMKASYSGVFYDRMIKGLWTNAEGAIYDMWTADTHIIPYAELPRMQRILGVGIDYGTTNATSAILLGLGVDHRLYAIAEWRHDSKADQINLTNGAIVEGITTWLDGLTLPDGSRPMPEWLIHDPSAASLRVEMASRGIVNMFPANNEVLYGIQTVASVLDGGRLRVTDQCAGLIGEMSEYAWDTKATENGEDKPLKVNDHSVDALRYVVTSTESNWRPYLTQAA
jgi:PBSX family phage terminase large subunit